jgi:D-aminopeptidase
MDGMPRPADLGTRGTARTGVSVLLPPADEATEPPAESCIAVVVTDAPVDGADCTRLARRIGLGLARTGSTAHHSSGEIFLAASTTWRADRDDPTVRNGSLREQALDSMLMATTTVGRDGNPSEGLDPERLRERLR